MSQLHVVQVVCSDAFSGVERYVTTLSSALAQDGCHVTVLGGDGDRMKADLARADVRWIASKSVIETMAHLRRIPRADVFHAHMTEAELAAVLTSIRRSVPVVATRHFAQRRGSRTTTRLAARLITRRLAAQLAISNYVAQATEGKSVVVTPGSPSRHALRRAGEREQAVLMAQRLDPEKRTDLAIRAWSRSGLGPRGWQLWIAGDGRERGALESLADSLGVATSCRFLGARSDVDQLQERAGIFLAPRPDEPLGLSVIEAMSAGTPIVAAAGGGHLETVGKCEDAALYPPFEPAEAARLLVEMATDPVRRDTYGSELRKIHRQAFSVEQQLAGTLAVYGSVLR